MVIGIPTESVIAAVELGEKLGELAPVTQAPHDDGCVLLVEVDGTRLKPVLDVVGTWAVSWGRGEVDLLLDRQRYCLRARRDALDWVEVGHGEAARALDDVEV